MFSFGNWGDKLDAWLTTPPEEDSPVMIDELENEIYEDEEYVDLNGWILSRDSLEDVSACTDDDGMENVECTECGNTFESTSEKVYLINGDWFCEECVEKAMQRAVRRE